MTRKKSTHTRKPALFLMACEAVGGQVQAGR